MRSTMFLLDDESGQMVERLGIRSEGWGGGGIVITKILPLSFQFRRPERRLLTAEREEGLICVICVSVQPWYFMCVSELNSMAVNGGGH